MLSNRLVLCILFSLSVLAALPSIAQDSLATVHDSTVVSKPEAGAPTYKNLFYLSGVMAMSNNDVFQSNYVDKGTGMQLGLPLFTHRFYTLRFNVGYTIYQFKKDEYLADNGLDTLDATSTNMETVTFLPDILIHPFPKWIVSPYANLGVGLIVGSKDATATVTQKNGTASTTHFSFGNRLIGHFGAGAIVRLSPSFNVLLGAAYNLEFLKDNQPEDIFYKFKKPDNSYKFIYYTVGVQFKLKQK